MKKTSALAALRQSVCLNEAVVGNAFTCCVLAQKCDLVNGGVSDKLNCFECVCQCIIKPGANGERECKTHSIGLP